MKRFDFSGVMFKGSTWLGLFSSSCAAAILTYDAWPERLQNLIPDWGILALGLGALSSSFTPVVVAFKQKRFQPDDTDGAGA